MGSKRGSCSLKGYPDNIRVIIYAMVINLNYKAASGADPVGGGGSWGSGPPPPFWETPKFNKEEKNVTRVHSETPRFSTEQLPGPPPPPSPLSEILYPALQGKFREFKELSRQNKNHALNDDKKSEVHVGFLGVGSTIGRQFEELSNQHKGNNLHDGYISQLQ